MTKPLAQTSASATTRWKLALLLLAAAIALIDLWAFTNWRAALDPATAGSMLTKTVPTGHDGWRRIIRFGAGSPIAAAGATVGDEIRPERLSDFYRPVRVDEHINFTLRSKRVERTLSLRPALVAGAGLHLDREVVSYLSGWLGRLVSLLIGTLLVLRRSDSPAIRTLALALLLQDSWGWYYLPGGDFREQWELWLGNLADATSRLAALMFALRYPEQRPHWQHRWVRMAFFAIAALLGLSFATWELDAHGLATVTDSAATRWLAGEMYPYGPWNVQEAALLVALWWSWRAAEGPTRKRMAWIGLALAAPSLVGLGVGLASQTSLWERLNFHWEFLATDMALFAGSLCLGWAVLRHRVFNFGLVVQRALAFSVVSTLVLMTLGLGKWATEQFLHGAEPRHSLVYDAAVAMMVVAVFAFVQKRVIERVNQIFFRRWHQAAENLRAFVDAAEHIGDATELQRRYVEAVDAFSGACGSAIYVADGQRHLRRLHATLADAPDRVNAHDELAIELRRGTRRVDLSRLATSSSLLPAGDWAFPMTVRGQISGALLVGARPDGVAYRPEELAQLTESTRRIGLDLESLRLIDLQCRNDALAQHNAEQALEIDELKAALRAAATK